MSTNTHSGHNTRNANGPRFRPHTEPEAADVFEAMHAEDIYLECLTEAQRQQIALDFYDTLDVDDFAEIFERAQVGCPKMKARYAEFRDKAVRQLVRNGSVEAP